MRDEQFTTLISKLEEIRCGLIDVEEEVKVLSKENTPEAFYQAFKLIQADPHGWSDRPCATCNTISSLIGEPFGCVLHTKRKGE